MLVSVRLHRPQNKARDLYEVEKSENRPASKGWKIPGYLTDEDTIRLGTALLKDFYEAPFPSGKKNLTWLNRFRDNRRALEAFWTGLRKTPRKIFEMSNFNAEEIRSSLDIISTNLTREYMDSVHNEETEILASIDSVRLPAAVSVQMEWGTSSVEDATAPTPKFKSKTRPAQPAGNTEEIHQRVADLTVGSVIIETSKSKVKPLAYNMVTLIFPATAMETTKSMEWDIFVHAMSDMGFSARNGGGSAVVFESDNMGEGRAKSGKIVFHKPHPIRKIDPVVMQSWGKRMAKWFGWHRELFVLEG